MWVQPREGWLLAKPTQAEEVLAQRVQFTRRCVGPGTVAVAGQTLYVWSLPSVGTCDQQRGTRRCYAVLWVPQWDGGTAWGVQRPLPGYEWEGHKFNPGL